jgi:hypothetical protein
VVTRDEFLGLEDPEPSWPIGVVVLALLATLGFMVLTIPDPPTDEPPAGLSR